MEDIIDKLKNERVDYTQLGFNSNGLRQPISQNTIYANQYDQQENSVYGRSVTGFNGKLKLNSQKGRIELFDDSGNMIALFGNDAA